MKRSNFLFGVIISIVFALGINPSFGANEGSGAKSVDGVNPAPAALPLLSEQENGLSVALIADGDSGLNDVAQKLSGTGKIGSIDQYNIISGPVPTLNVLQTYDSVLVWGGEAYWGETKSEELGNVLADYVDNGGGVIIATFSLGSNSGSWIPTGRFSDLTYWCLEPKQNQTSGQKALGTIYQPGHPIMSDVYTFDGGSSSYRVNTSSVLDAESIADWTDSLPLIATKNLGFALRVDLNFFPPSNDVRSDFWDASTDGDEIMANALVWVAGSSWGKAYNTVFDSPSDLELLREYRDKILSRSAKGRIYKKLLYKYSEKALKVFFNNPELMMEANALIQTRTHLKKNEVV